MIKKEPKVHIILLNYNGYKDTVECIESINNITYNNYKVVVVDNNSTDNSKIELKKFLQQYDKVHFIQSDKNLGFSGGNNIGINWSLNNGADYICLLNNDTIVEPDFLTPLIMEMEKDDTIGISAGKIMYFKEKDILWSAGGYISNARALGCHYGINMKDEGQFNDIRECTFLTGCIQLIRGSVFKKVGMYNHEYFLYMEDVEFCKRVVEAGYKLKYVPTSKIYHKVSASTGGDESPLQLYYLTRNRILFNKNNKRNKLSYIKFYILLAMKILIEPFRKKHNYKYIVFGVVDGLRGKYGEKNIKWI